MWSLKRTAPSRVRWLLFSCGGAFGAILCLPVFSRAGPDDAGSAAIGREPLRIAQADGTSGGDTQTRRQSPPIPKAKPKAEPAKPGGKTEPGKTEAEKGAGSGNGSVPNGLAGAAAAGASTNNGSYDIAARLSQNGAGTCASVIDAEAAPSMVGVTESDTVSQWSTVEPRDRHAASVFIAQRYANNPAVPYGVTGLVASPNTSGSCDVTTVQVVASPLPCGRVRDTLARSGKMLGELVGLPLMQSADGQTLLMPTATNTCVLVGFRSKFGN